MAGVTRVQVGKGCRARSAGEAPTSAALAAMFSAAPCALFDLDLEALFHITAFNDRPSTGTIL